MKWGKQLTLFTVGGGAYVGLELLYRGRSHISMFGAGGLCFLLMGALRKKRLPAFARLVGGRPLSPGWSWPRDFCATGTFPSGTIGDSPGISWVRSARCLPQCGFRWGRRG